jgi:hypothetical protein
VPVTEEEKGELQNSAEVFSGINKERLAAMKREAHKRRSISPPFNPTSSRFTRDETARQRVDPDVHESSYIFGYDGEELLHNLDDATLFELYCIRMRQVNFLSSFYNYWSYVQ